MDREEQQIIRRFEELSRRGEDYYAYSDFLTLYEQGLLQRMGKKIRLWGGTQECERKLAAFGDPEALGYEPEFPIVCISCKPKDQRYADTLTHRDVLGSVLGLGIERTCVGDVFLLDNVAYVFVQEHMGEYIADNLKKIKHTDVICALCEPDPEKLAPKRTPMDAVCASRRVDAAIAGVYHLSRSEAAALIAKGSVMRNGKEVTSGSGELADGDILSVRGYGRFRLEEEGRQTQSGRTHLHVSIYG